MLLRLLYIWRNGKTLSGGNKIQTLAAWLLRPTLVHLVRPESAELSLLEMTSPLALGKDDSVSFHYYVQSGGCVGSDRFCWKLSLEEFLQISRHPTSARAHSADGAYHPHQSVPLAWVHLFRSVSAQRGERYQGQESIPMITENSYMFLLFHPQW